MTRAFSAAALAAAAILCACSNLPEVAAGACGNGVVEPGEDCDGASAAGGTCGADGDNACHFVCEGGAACPTGYACGADQRCRAPSALFAPAKGPYAFDANDVAAGDVDGDGTDDLVGVGATTLTARFGNASADLFASTSAPIRTPVAHAVFGDLDGDGRLDVIVPSSVGVFSFLASGDGFNPYPYTSLTLDDQTSPVRTGAVDIGDSPFSSILAMIGKTMAYINTQPQYAVCIDGGTPPACGGLHDAGDLIGDSLPTGRTGYEFGFVATPAQDLTDELVLAFKNADHVDLWSPTLPKLLPSGDPDLTTLSLEKIQTITLPKEGTFGTQVRVADDGLVAFGSFDHDGCTDLLIPIKRVDAGGRYEGFAIAYGSKIGAVCTGRLDAPVVVAEAALGTTDTTKGLIPRAVLDLDGDGVSDLVTNALIAVTSCTRDTTGCPKGQNNVFALDFRSFTPRAWTQAVATDVNGDHKPDVAGIVAGQDDVDLMLGAGSGLVNRFQIATALPARAIRTGDFDGDLFLDLAVITGDRTDPTTEDDHLVVSFGAAAGGPSAPVDMGSFGVIEQAQPVSIFTDLESVDAITDLVVIDDRDQHRGVAPLIGSSTRRLLAPYLLAEGNATDQTSDAPVAIQLGQYDGDQAARPDVVALAHQVPQAGPTSTDNVSIDPTPRMFLLAGQGAGNLIGGQPTIPSGTPPNFEYRDAVWASARLAAGATNDSIVGVDATDDKHHEVQAASPHLFVATPDAGGGWTLQTPIALPSPYDALRVHAIELVDLDADGLPDLLIRMVSATPKGTGPASTGTTALVVWNHGGTLDVAHPTAVFAADAICHGAAVLQADLDPARELAAVCVDAAGGQSVTIYDWSGAAWTKTAAPFSPSGASPALVVGDFNGDTLADLAVLSGTGATATAQVYVQCAVGDVACAAQTQQQLTTSGM